MISTMSATALHLQSLRVSPHSVWTDRTWFYTNPVDGQNEAHSQLTWSFDLGDGGSILDTDWELLLGEMRAFAFTGVENPARGQPIALGRMKNLAAALEELAVFLAESGLNSLNDIDSETSWEFAEFLLETYTSRNKVIGRERKVVHSAMMRILEWLPVMWDQRHAMKALGFDSLSEEPFDGKSPFNVVTEEMGLSRTGRLRPIPDEVAVPIMNVAFDMCAEPAQDVIGLQDSVLVALGHSDLAAVRKSTPAQYAEARNVILGFEFARPATSIACWRDPIGQAHERELIDGRQVTLEPLQSLRHLVISITSACCIALQSGTGMRAHELCSLDDTSEDSDVNPSCLSSRISKDGSIESFYVKGFTAKGGPLRPAEWLVGSRPVGSQYVPGTVRALRVLKSLWRPWRKLSGRTRLLLSFTAGKGLPRSADSIGPMTSCRLTYLQKEFVHEYVDLSHLSADLRDEFERRKAIRAHRWRTTFATNLYSFDPGLLPAIRDHFKHMNDAITLTGYIGSDPSVVEACDSIRTMTAARILLGVSTGSAPVMGSMNKIIEKFGPLLREAIAKHAGDTLEEKAVEFVMEHDIQIWNQDYGRCFLSFMPQDSACHQKKGTPSFLRRRPAFDFRSPDTCAGCRCFAIFPQHLDAWRRRRDEAAAVLDQARLSGEQALSELRVEKARHLRAERIVKGLERRTEVAS